MPPKILLTILLLMVTGLAGRAQGDGESTAPFTEAEREAVYNAAISRRADAILAELELTDTNKVARVHAIVVAQYRALRARDEALDAMFQALKRNAPGVESNRPVILQPLSRQLHDQFLARLTIELTPEQLEKVKDKMTYNKVQVTYDAYCQIVPNLAEADKAKMLRLLKDAREEAMDGGSADEKSTIFQKYKNQINAYLDARGHNVALALKNWEATHPVSSTNAPKPEN